MRFWNIAVLCLGGVAGLGGVGPAAAAPVTVAPFARLAAYPAKEAPAQVESLNDSKVSAEVSARIVAVKAQVGDRVRRGQTLFRLDCGSYELAAARLKSTLQAAEARRRLAKNQLSRNLTLVNQNFISRAALNQHQTDFEASTAELMALNAELAAVRRDIAHCTVVAPFDGVVRERAGQLGEFVTVGQPLLNLVDAEHVEVSARLQPALLASYRDAGTLAFTARGRAYPVAERAAAALFDRQERSTEVRLRFTGDKPPPGETGVLGWKSATPHVPADLLVSRGGRLGVFVAEGGRAKFVPLAQAVNGRAVPAPELALSARVVTAGRHALADGAALQIR